MTPEARKLFLDHCEFALGELLTAYFGARDTGTGRPLFKEGTCCLLNDKVSYATLASFEILERPVSGALRAAMRRIGEDLFEDSGDDSLMREMIERLEAKLGTALEHG